MLFLSLPPLSRWCFWRHLYAFVFVSRTSQKRLCRSQKFGQASDSFLRRLFIKHYIFLLTTPALWGIEAKLCFPGLFGLRWIFQYFGLFLYLDDHLQKKLLSCSCSQHVDSMQRRRTEAFAFTLQISKNDVHKKIQIYFVFSRKCLMMMYLVSNAGLNVLIEKKMWSHYCTDRQ